MAGQSDPCIVEWQCLGRGQWKRRSREFHQSCGRSRPAGAALLPLQHAVNTTWSNTVVADNSKQQRAGTFTRWFKFSYPWHCCWLAIRRAWIHPLPMTEKTVACRKGCFVADGTQRRKYSTINHRQCTYKNSSWIVTFSFYLQASCDRCSRTHTAPRRVSKVADPCDPRDHKSGLCQCASIFE